MVGVSNDKRGTKHRVTRCVSRLSCTRLTAQTTLQYIARYSGVGNYFAVYFNTSRFRKSRRRRERNICVTYCDVCTKRVRQLAQNTEGLEKAGTELVNDGLLTKDEAAKAINEVKAMEYAEAKTSGAVKITENMLEAAALITKKEQLTKEKEQTDPSLAGDIDNRIASIDKQLKQIKEKDDADVRDIIKNEKDAIQKQETGDILDAQPTESVQEVEEEVREPSIETEEEVTEKEVSDRKSRIDSKPKIFGDFHTDSKLPYGKAEIYDITPSDNKGVQTAKYNNPNTGTLDVIISSSGTSTNFVGFTRVYEGGKPTNKFTAKMESTGDAFKNMVTSAESTLPPGSEVIETTSISLGGINTYKKSKILKPKLLKE